jgi:hypothetical protein
MMVGLLAPAVYSQEDQSGRLDEEPLSAANYKCWTSGSGMNYYRVCVSKHGNVVEVASPAGNEYIRVGGVFEGYVACAGTSAGGATTAYYDAASLESGWAEPYSVTTAPVISRKTADGRLELVQNYAVDAAERDFTITMTLYNRSGGALYKVRLDRYADFDLSNTVKSDIFHKSPRAVFATDQAAPTNLLIMTELTPAHITTAVHSWKNWRKDQCNQPSGASPTAPEDWVGRISYHFGTMANGASKTVKLQYRLQ